MCLFSNGDVKFKAVSKNEASVWKVELVQNDSHQLIVKISFSDGKVLEEGQTKCAVTKDRSNLSQQWVLYQYADSHNDYYFRNLEKQQYLQNDYTLEGVARCASERMGIREKMFIELVVNNDSKTSKLIS